MSRQLFKYNPVTGYTYIPGIKARVQHEGGGYLLKANQSGFRCDREFTAEKTACSKRILLFGDSLTAGDGVSDRQRFCDILENLLSDVEVFNFGLAGTGTDQQYLVFREFASALENDLVIIATAAENIRRNVARYRVYYSDTFEQQIFAKPYFSLESDGSLHLRHSPVPRKPILEEQLSARERSYVDRGGRYYWLYRLLTRVDARLVDLVQKMTRYQPLPGYGSRRSYEWRLMRAILEEWIAACPGKVLLCPLPNPQFIEETADPKAYQMRFQELAADCGVVFHDLLASFWATPKDERRQFRFSKDPHPSPIAHELIANSLVPVVKKLLNLNGK